MLNGLNLPGDLRQHIAASVAAIASDHRLQLRIGLRQGNFVFCTAHRLPGAQPTVDAIGVANDLFKALHPHGLVPVVSMPAEKGDRIPGPGNFYMDEFRAIRWSEEGKDHEGYLGQSRPQALLRKDADGNYQLAAVAEPIADNLRPQLLARLHRWLDAKAAAQVQRAKFEALAQPKKKK